MHGKNFTQHRFNRTTTSENQFSIFSEDTRRNSFWKSYGPYIQAGTILGMTRILMIYTGAMFINIPIIDSALRALIVKVNEYGQLIFA